ncbi:hypothetical protein HY642_00195 [Candidatus Woesearchaeota archaeon]|nr:hypothetical protein [Candidatus Woesearchaeota archaeon]
MPPTGANYCEDYSAVSNKSMCERIAGSPWFMPCKWNNFSTGITTDDRCEFNGGGFFGGGGGDFHDLGSKSMCEAAGGEWKTQTYQDPSGGVREESWCDMKFGFGAESCDSACWACEFQPGGAAWASVGDATTACQNSRLGYCRWRNASAFERAPNSFGFCEKPYELQREGCGSKKSCEGYKYFVNPQQACDDDDNCRWMIDPMNPALGWCADAGAKTCQQSCGQCANEQQCQFNGTSCQWDYNLQLCKAGQGSNAEVCFDGVDNDNDGMVDCADTGCMSDPFCGGSAIHNCGGYMTNTSCTADTACAWLVDEFTNFTWCDVLGANCWMNDDSEADCNATGGCRWYTTTFSGDPLCEVNETYFNACFSIQNASSCSANANCSWIQFRDGNSGFCEAKPWTCFDRYWNNQTGCQADTSCSWLPDPYMPGGGRCESLCEGRNSTTCNSDSQCSLMAGFCDPTTFQAGGCWQLNGNQSGCINVTGCVWMPDQFFDNNSMGKPDRGWCNDAFMSQQFEGMEQGPPAIIATDDCGAGSGDAGLQDHVDICGVGVKDMDNAYGIGAGVDSLALAVLCKDKPLQSGGTGTGTLAGKYYYFLDTNDVNNDSCNSTNNAALGFEFYFAYETSLSSNQLSEKKTSFRCSNGTWAAAPIPFNTWPEKACKEIGAAVIAVDKESLESYTALFNKTAPMRMYVLAANASGNATYPQDAAGPGFYKPGSVDFIAEDCRGLVDRDGDGCLPAEDSDCMVFNKFGFVPFEDCWNDIDDNFDGNVDCDDPACKYDPFACSGQLVADPNDKEPPQLAEADDWAFPEGMSVMLNTFEPSNASLAFYARSAGCSALNRSITDVGYKPWHMLPIDNFGFNPQRVGFAIAANTTYFYKYTLCDVSGNCLVSACTNITTPASYSECGVSCKTFLDDMDYAAPNGTNASSPEGFMEIRYDLDADGDWDVNISQGGTSDQRLLNETRLVNILFTNPNSTEPWAIVCINGTVPATISFNSSRIDVNDSGDGRVGMGTDAYKSLFQADFDCDRIQITVPYNGSDLWHCVNASGTGTTGCTNVTGNATRISDTVNSSTWEVDPSLLGFSFYQSSGTSGGGGNNNNGGSSGGGGGGGGGSCLDECSSGFKACASLTARYECGDFDSDSCRDLKTTNCASNQICKSGDCVCEEQWVCDAWSECTAGKQTRACTDTKNCGTKATMPPTERSCTATQESASSALSETPSALTLEVGKSSQFTLNGAAHALKLLSVTTSGATFEIASTPQTVLVMLNEVRRLDLDSDGAADMTLELTGVTASSATVSLAALPLPPPAVSMGAQVPKSSISPPVTAAVVAPPSVEKSNTWVWIVAAVVLIVAVVLFRMRERNPWGNIVHRK